ncbi:hypothetical protein L3C95_33975 [Chitinophaga filiformis]|uniref:hypothetical protein n=1 Tax=Chitinophaga filiformis TaxID=104663 RepID=UPI001F22ED30|nr:hypothetical protein [Chitinophaga filiformis]MCF6407945.1 hypothetical protein [Chitinophaga filiformis]
MLLKAAFVASKTEKIPTSNFISKTYAFSNIIDDYVNEYGIIEKRSNEING